MDSTTVKSLFYMQLNQGFIPTPYMEPYRPPTVVLEHRQFYNLVWLKKVVLRYYLHSHTC